MKRWLITGGFLGICALLMVVLFLGFGRNPHAVPFGMKGKTAPPFTLRDLATNQPVSLEQLKGKPVVINFWASWCGPCKVEHPYLEWGNEQFGDQVVFLGMVFEDTEDNARKFLRQYGSSYPQLVDPHSKTAVAYGVAGVPETYFITRDGVILDKHVGPIPPSVLAERVKELVEMKSPTPAATAVGGGR